MIRRILCAVALALALTSPWAAHAQDAHLAAMQQVPKLASAKEYAQAEAAAKQWVADTVAKRGENHEHTSDALQKLAFVLEVQNRGAEAEPLRRRVVAIQEKLLGPDHLNTAGRSAVEARVASCRTLAASEAAFRAMRASLAHPFFRAPFVHVGD